MSRVRHAVFAGLLHHMFGCMAGQSGLRLADASCCGAAGAQPVSTLHPLLPPGAGNPEPAIAMLSAALSGVWPPSRAMQRRLVARQFVPTAEGEAAQQEGAQQGEAGAGSSGGGKAGADEGPSSSAAAGQQEEAEEGPTELAVALGAALEQHCPGLSLADIQKAALCLRLFLGCRAVGEQASDGPSFQASRGHVVLPS